MGHDDDNLAYKDDLNLFEMTAHHTLSDLKYLCELADRLGTLKEWQRAALGMAWLALDEFFPQPDHQQERAF